MANSNSVQSSFLGGEWSKYAQGRIDLPEYKTAMALCRNSLPMQEGAWTRRPGFLVCGDTRAGNPGVIRRFLLPDGAPCYVEMTYQGGGSFAQFWVANAAGTGFVRLVNDTRSISAISTANPAAVTVSEAEAWITSDDVIFNLDPASAIGPASYLQQREFDITVVDTTHFTVVDMVTSAGVDGSTLSYTNSAADTVSRVTRVTLPYTSLADLESVRVVKADNMALLLARGYAPQALYWTGSTFILTSVDTGDLDGPYLDPLAGASQQSCSTSVVGSWEDSTTTFEITDGAYTFTSADVGKILRVWFQPPAFDPTFNYVATIPDYEYFVTYGGAYWGLSGANNKMPIGTPPGNSYTWSTSIGPQTVVPWTPAPDAGNWNFAVITGYVSGSTVDIEWLATRVVYPNNPAYLSVDIWQLGVFAAGSYPGCGAYHEGRLLVAGAQLNRLDGSVSDALDPSKVAIAGGTIPGEAFQPTDVNNNVGDANGIAAVLNDSEQNTIHWVIPHQQGVLMGCADGEFLVSASALNDPLTPTSIQAHRASRFKAANAEALSVRSVSIFLQAGAREIIEYGAASMFTTSFMGLDLNERARHLAAPGVLEVAYQEGRAPVLWARRVDGVLIGSTYRRDTPYMSEPPKFNGWHGHTHGRGHLIESICTGPRPDGTIECLMAITRDPVTSYRRVEMLTPIAEETDPLAQAMLVDGAVIAAGTDGGTSSITLYNLNDYAGTNVDIWIGGLYGGNHTVATNGSVAVPYGSDPDGLLTAAYLQTISGSAPYGGWVLAAQIDVTIASSLTRVVVPCAVGVCPVAQGQTLRPNTRDDAQTASGPALGMSRRGHIYAMQLVNAVGNGLTIGPDFSNLLPVSFASPAGVPYTAVTAKTGVHKDEFDGDYDFDGMVAWQATGPWPVTISGISVFINTQER